MLRRVPKDPQRSSDKSAEEMAGQPKRMFRFLLWAALFTLIVLWGYQAMLGQKTGADIPYSQFRAAVAEGRVKSVHIRGDEVQGVYGSAKNADSEASEASRSGTRFVTHVPSVGDEELLSLLEDNGVVIRTASEGDGTWMFIAAAVVPALLFLGFLTFMARKARGSRRGA